LSLLPVGSFDFAQDDSGGYRTPFVGSFGYAQDDKYGNGIPTFISLSFRSLPRNLATIRRFISCALSPYYTAVAFGKDFSATLEMTRNGAFEILRLRSE
jgi:hypothetical protein